ncbi:hypothetical protein GC194_13700 [bacterium]|nr:hypothetical protein [bacterium]
MPVRDLLKAELDRMGAVLKTLLSQLIGGNDGADLEQTQQEVAYTLKQQLDVELDQILNLQNEALWSYLAAHKIEAQMMEQLAEILMELSKKTGCQQPMQYLTKSKDLLTHAEQISKSTSFHRINLLDQLNRQTTGDSPNNAEGKITRSQTTGEAQITPKAK